MPTQTISTLQVIYLTAGFLSDRETVVDVDTRDPAEAAAIAPADAYGFYFNRMEMIVEAEAGDTPRIIDGSIASTPTFFIASQQDVMDDESILALPPGAHDRAVVLEYLKTHHSPAVVRCRDGKLRAFYTGTDQLISLS